MVGTIRPQHRVERSKGEEERPDFAGRLLDAFAKEGGALRRKHEREATVGRPIRVTISSHVG
jgi:hypothetical protein